MTYNNEQIEAIQKIKDWMLAPNLSDENNFYTLIGYAGTGKTTIVKEILANIGGLKIVVSAPTHAAKKIIAKKTEKPGETIQKILGLRPNIELDNFNPNKPIFDPKAEPTIGNYDVVIIDEASMINRHAFKMITQLALDYNTKVLFIGDDAQLPPVKEVKSPVFLEIVNVSSLSIIERQKDGNPNNIIIDIARNDVINQTNNLVSYLQKNPIAFNENGEGYALYDKSQFYYKSLEYYFNSEFQVNTDYVKTITWSNSAVGVLNNFYRKKLYPEAKELITIGDLVKGYRNVSKETAQAPYFMPLIENSEEYLVKKVNIVTKTYLKIPLLVYETTLDNDKVLDILHPDSYERYSEEITNRLIKAKTTRNWKQYYDFHDKIVLISNCYDSMGEVLTAKHIDYGYASTVHKTQGSTYKNVCINLDELLKNPNPVERRKLIYVALSRCENVNLIKYG
jgi:exodeoxyribonuclease-5